MRTTLSITSTTHDEAFVQKLTQDLNKALNQEPEIEALLAKRSGVAGDKGDPITVGAILVSVLGGGGLVGLINVIKSFFVRSSAVEMEFERPDGKRFKLKADDLNSEQEKRTLKIAHEFFGDLK